MQPSSTKRRALVSVGLLAVAVLFAFGGHYLWITAHIVDGLGEDRPAALTFYGAGVVSVALSLSSRSAVAYHSFAPSDVPASER